MQIKNTKDVSNTHLSYLIFGNSKTGKTRLSTTTPPNETLLINVENNLASICGAGVNFADATTWAEFMEALLWLENASKDQLPKWIVIDSITELVKVLLRLEISIAKDPRQAYGEIGVKIPDVIRRLKALPINLVCLAQQGYIKDDVGGEMHFGAAMDGKQLSQSLPYMFDAVLATRAMEHDGELHYVIQCRPTNQYDNIGIRTSFTADKGAISEYELPNLLNLHNKIIAHEAS